MEDRMDRGKDMDRSLVGTRCTLIERLLRAQGQAARLRGCSQRGWVRGSLALASFCLLAGCVDNNIASQAPPPPHPTNIARRPGVSPSGATVALASFTGAPDGVKDRFTNAFDTAAKAQGIVTADPAAANYLVRGYLNAVPESDGTAVTYVLDVFDSQKQRAQRVEDRVDVKAKAPDPWSVIDDRVLAAVATKSAAELAAVLTNTPEAILASAEAKPMAESGRPATVVAQDQEGGRTVVNATPPETPSAGPPGASSPGPDLRSVALQEVR